MRVTVCGASGLTNAYTSVLSASGSDEMSGASRWLEASARKTVPNTSPAPSAHPATRFMPSLLVRLATVEAFDSTSLRGARWLGCCPCSQGLQADENRGACRRVEQDVRLQLLVLTFVLACGGPAAAHEIGNTQVTATIAAGTYHVDVVVDPDALLAKLQAGRAVGTNDVARVERDRRIALLGSVFLDRVSVWFDAVRS